jgi:hypothetical protein
MQMDDVGAQLLEDPVEVRRGLEEMAAHVRVNSETFIAQAHAKIAKNREPIDAWSVPQFTLQAAHLRDEHFGSTHLHAVCYVSYFHRQVCDIIQFADGLVRNL